jgi:hypothetical protein
MNDLTENETEQLREEVREYVDIMTRAYLTTALWSSVDERHIENPEDFPEMLDASFEVNDIDEGSYAEARADCEDFALCNWTDLMAAFKVSPGFHRNGNVYDASQAGHDFWLTRNGHGAGFWDRGLGMVGDRLTENSKPYGEANLYVEDDGTVYYQG